MHILRIIAFITCFITINAQEIFSEKGSFIKRRRHIQNKFQKHSKEFRSYVYPLVWDKGKVFLEVDYIYWKPVAKIPYATTMEIVTIQNPFDNSYELSTNRTIQRVDLKSKSGFKAEFGTYLSSYGWLTSGEYTYLKRTSSGSASGEENNNVTNAAVLRDLNAIWRTVPLGDNIGNPERLTDASANQKLSYQVFDWIMQKTIFWKEKFGFSPYFGVRGAWIKNRLDVTYNGIRTRGTSGPFPIQDLVRIQSDYRAGGLRAGLKGNWILGCGFEIFGNTSMSLVYGQHDIRQRENFQRLLGSGANANNLLRGSTTSANDWKAIRSAFQLVLGMDWGHNFKNDNMFFGLKLAYEVNLWPDVIQLRKLMRDARLDVAGQPPNLGSNTTNDPSQDFNRSLGLQGLTVGIRFDF